VHVVTGEPRAIRFDPNLPPPGEQTIVMKGRCIILLVRFEP
jgi:hypothetical protein